MVVEVIDAQRRTPVNTARMARLARCAVRRLGIRTPGRLSITFIDSRRMRTLNRTFLSHDRTTDVLSFRYDGPPAGPRLRRGQQVVGDILVAPSVARRYAREHRIPYADELGRYVVHGILHWLGKEDRTKEQRATMRMSEDQILAHCRPISRRKIRGHGHSHH